MPFSVSVSHSAVLWMCVMGGVASKAASREEVWFVDQLLRMRNGDPRLREWDGARTMLKEMLFVDVVHQVPCRKLWQQVGKIYDLKKRWDKQVEMHW